GCVSEEDPTEFDEESADLIGNRLEGESCTLSIQCSADEGLICRPAPNEQRVYRECGPRNNVCDFCSSSSECQTGRCLYGQCMPWSHDQACPGPPNAPGVICLTPAGWCYPTEFGISYEACECLSQVGWIEGTYQ